MADDWGTPSDAMCVLHPQARAALACGRCGNFMCAECAEHGLERQCPTCRQRFGSDAFPFRRDDFNFDRLWNHVWAAFKRDWAMLSVCVLIYMALAVVSSVLGALVNAVITAIGTPLIGAAGGSDGASLGAQFGLAAVSQVVTALISMPITGIALLGMYRVTLDSVRGRAADPARMFVTLRRLPTYLVVSLGLNVVTFGSMAAVAAVLFGIAMKVANIDVGSLAGGGVEGVVQLVQAPAVIVAFLGVMAWVLIVTLVMLPLTIFSVPEVVVSDVGALEVLRRAWRIGSGQRLRIVGYSLVGGLVTVLGMIACLLPVIPAIGLMMCLLAALFSAARNGLGLPEPVDP